MPLGVGCRGGGRVDFLLLEISKVQEAVIRTAAHYKGSANAAVFVMTAWTLSCVQSQLHLVVSRTAVRHVRIASSNTRELRFQKASNRHPIEEEFSVFHRHT